MAKTRTTKQLSEALAQIQAEAITRIGFLFKKKRHERLSFTTTQAVHIEHNRKRCNVYEVTSEGRVKFTLIDGYGLRSDCMLLDLSADSLLIILDEIERMKKAGQIKK
jgi:hypothetical protein